MIRLNQSKLANALTHASVAQYLSVNWLTVTKMFSLSRIGRRLYSSAAEIPKGFWWLEDGKLAAVSKPKAKSDLEYLKNNGVTHLVSLTEKVPDFHGVDITSVHMPVESGGMNSIEQANEFYRLVEDVSCNGGSVALHCGEGQGRASVLLACYAVKADSLEAEEAICRIRRNRPNAISNQERENLVKDYEKSLKQR